MDCVIVSGAGSGIGREVAIDLGKTGAHIVCISKTHRASETAALINANGGFAEHVIIDLADHDSVERRLGRWVSENNYKQMGVVLAAGVLGPRGPLEVSSLAEWDECWKVNVLGNLAILTQVLPEMIKNGFGRIVTFAGGGASYAYPLFPAYAATKSAMVRVTENLHEDLKSKGDFAIVCLAPGANKTEMLKKVRAAGAEVKTVVEIREPVNFTRKFLNSKSCGFSGSFVHVRDAWADYLDTDNRVETHKWKLRRME